MKNHYFIFLIIILIPFACDPSGTAYLLIENQRDFDGTVTFYKSPIDEIDSSYVLIKNANSEISHYSVFGGGARYIIQFEEDSIIFKFSDDKYIRYYKDSVISGKKNIYRESDWKINENGRNTEFTFTVTDDDVSIK